MKILDFFRTPRKRSAAQVAKERLQIIVSHETSHDDEHFINDLQRELLQVISKYVNIDPEQIKVQLEKHGGQSVLELNVTLPDLMKQPRVRQPETPPEEAKKAEQGPTNAEQEPQVKAHEQAQSTEEKPVAQTETETETTTKSDPKPANKKQAVES